MASRNCISYADESDAARRRRNAVSSPRTAPIRAHTNGAEVARADLSMRGPGDLFGARQTGALPLRFARFIGDAKMIEDAGDMAEQWLRRDPALKEPASAGARAALKRMLDFGFSLGDVG